MDTLLDGIKKFEMEALHACEGFPSLYLVYEEEIPCLKGIIKLVDKDEDVIDEYVSIERAEKDYGVVIREMDSELDLFEVDEEATKKTREYIRNNRKKWLTEDIHKVEEMYRNNEIDSLDLIRKYGVIFDFETNKVLPKSTEQYREMLMRRTVPHWE